MASPLVYNATVQTFQAEVVDRSMTVPVLVDFWADWCAPCKAFAPVLEAVAAEYDGAFVVAKVDSEAEAELSQAFQVQSIPFGVLVIDGRPADAFQRGMTDVELRAFLKKNGIEPAGEPATPEEADPDAPESRLKLAREAVRSGDLATVRDALVEFPEESDLLSDRENLLAGLVFLEADLEGSAPGAAELKQARDAFFAGEWEASLAAIVASAAADRSYADGLARKAMLLMQAVLGPLDMVDEHRRRLATLLY